MKTNLINVNGCNISVNESGKGDNVILFLHGNSLSSALFKDQMQSSLVDNYRLISFDFPGHGASAKPTNPEWAYSAAGFAAVVQSIITTYKITNCVICGHSFGGHLALQLSAILRPILKGLICVATPPIGIPPQLEKMYLPNPAFLLCYKPDLTEDEINLLSSICTNAPALLNIIKNIIRDSDPAIRAAIGQAIMTGQIANETEIVASLNIPIAFVAGNEDAILNKDYYNDLKAPTMYEKKLHLISNSAHCTMAENANEFNVLLERFCKTCF